MTIGVGGRLGLRQQLRHALGDFGQRRRGHRRFGARFDMALDAQERRDPQGVHLAGRELLRLGRVDQRQHHGQGRRIGLGGLSRSLSSVMINSAL